MTTFPSGFREPFHLATGFGLAETLVTVSFLEAYGFHPTASSLHHASTAWHHLMALGGVRISVPAQEAESAALLLCDIANHTPAIGPAPRNRRRIVWAILAFWWSGVPLPSSGMAYGVAVTELSKHPLHPDQNPV